MKKNSVRQSVRGKMMKINVVIALVGFLMYGGLFLFAVDILIEKYVNSDMDFILEECSDNLRKEFLDMEEIVLKTRESDLLMGFLKNGYTNGNEEKIEQEFSEITDINNWTKQSANAEPFVEEVYLFGGQGEFTSSFYYQFGAERRTESQKCASLVRNLALQERADEKVFLPYVREEAERLYIVCPILDDRLEAQGDLVFHIKQKTLGTLLSKLENYEGAFWGVYDTEKCLVDGNCQSNIQEALENAERMSEASRSQMINGERYRVVTKDLGIALKVILGIPENHAVRILYDNMGIYFWMVGIIFLVGILSFTVFNYKITKPLKEISNKIQKVTDGDFQTKMPEYAEKELYEISTGFNHMTEEINHLITEVYEKKLLLKEVELKFLQTQLNPHFIFNVLNAIGLQAKLEGNKELSHTIYTFSKLIQAKIYRSDTEKVSIRKELEYVDYYLQIQKFRYGDELMFSIEVEEKILDSYIQKLCIQLIVENAILHGIEPKMGKGHVRIFGCEKEGNIVIEIMDDGIGFPEDMDLEFPLTIPNKDGNHNRIGLNSIHAIIQLRYGPEYGLHIHSVPGNGSVVTLRVPFDYVGDVEMNKEEEKWKGAE